MNIKVLVASHKPYRMPADSIYFPVHVGAEGKTDIGFVKDNTQDNISAKNKNYCELTGLYWAWKNLDCDVLGLSHYRRHFVSHRKCGKKADQWQAILTGDQVKEQLKKADIILPRKRNYYIETNYSQYAHAHHAEDLDVTRQILSERYPNYLKAYDRSMKRTSGHRFNMFIMKRELADTYCYWLFDVLFELEKRLDISRYSAYDARVFGFVSERLLDVWIDTNGYSYTEMQVCFLEEVNWWVKGTNFLKRKFRKTTSV